MTSMIRITKLPAGLTRSFARSALILSVVLIMGNLNALIDHFLHPEIPYFDDEHLIVGGFSVLVTVIFMLILSVHVANLRKSKMEVQRLNKELEQKVEERTKQLVEAQEKLVLEEKLAFLGLIAGNMGNELRNPLGVMNNAVYYMKSAMPDADETIKEYLDIIDSEIRNSQRILSDLLDFSHTDTLQMKLVPVHELVRQSLERCAVPENIQLQTDLPEMLPPVKVDQLQMKRVFQNLIQNGIQAMPNGGRLRVSARRCKIQDNVGAALRGCPKEGDHMGSPLQETGDFIEISVTDRGKGIAPEHKDKLFQPLFSTKSRGIGLGLALSKKLTEANGGRIEVESHVGKGTTVTVILPAAGKGQ